MPDVALYISHPAPAVKVITLDTMAALSALAARVAALEAGGGGGGDSAVRVATATLLAGQSSVNVSLSAGETIAAVTPQRVEGIVFQGISISGTTHTVQFSDAPAANLALVLIIALP